jgi:hypothetical protein
VYKAITPTQIIEAGSMGADIYSETTHILSMDVAMYHVEWSGTAPVGTLYVQALLGKDPREPNAKWVNIEDLSFPLSGNTGVEQINLERICFPFIRLFYDSTSGVGTMNAWVMGKGQGG